MKNELKIPYVQERRMERMLIEALVQGILGWNELEYNCFVLKVGLQYTLLKNMEDKQVDMLFWKGFVNNWVERDRQFLCAFFKETNVEKARDAYRCVHNPKYL